jgi:hypothetical protein
LQGLLFQYPVCDPRAILGSAEPLCVKSQRNIDWVRFLSATVPPFVFASLGVFALLKLALRFDNQEQTRKRWMLARRITIHQVRQQHQAERAEKDVDDDHAGAARGGRAALSGQRRGTRGALADDDSSRCVAAIDLHSISPAPDQAVASMESANARPQQLAHVQVISSSRLTER